ncbi:hypothetical protein J2129_002525 [Methanofollis sp. W23]|nr:hypothetical protein [Methanofollis sp. W23]
MTIKKVLSPSPYRVAGGSGGGTPPARGIHQEDFYRAKFSKIGESVEILFGCRPSFFLLLSWGFPGVKPLDADDRKDPIVRAADQIDGLLDPIVIPENPKKETEIQFTGVQRTP